MIVHVQKKKHRDSQHRDDRVMSARKTPKKSKRAMEDEEEEEEAELLRQGVKRRGTQDECLVTRRYLHCCVCCVVLQPHTSLGRFKVQLPRAMTAMFCKRGPDIGRKTEAQIKARFEIFGAVRSPSASCIRGCVKNMCRTHSTFAAHIDMCCTYWQVLDQDHAEGQATRTWKSLSDVIRTAISNKILARCKSSKGTQLQFLCGFFKKVYAMSMFCTY
jgi:hypothetical protein